MPDLVDIDGSKGEGGGQILRTALVLSLFTGRSFRARQIRVGREVSGLKRQHVTILKALGRMSGSTVAGAQLGSSEVMFDPGDVHGGRYEFDVKTAGAVSLVLQTLLPVSLIADRKTEIVIGGGTDVAFSPTMTWVGEVIAPQIAARAEKLELGVLRRGFYPKGGGRVRLRITPRSPVTRTPISLTEVGTLIAVEGVSIASADLKKRRVAERQRQASLHHVRRLTGHDAHIRCRYEDAVSPGSSVTLWARGDRGATVGADALGERGKRAERVGEEAAEFLATELGSGAAVDRHQCDHLIPFLGLFGGELRTSHVTPHTQTNIWVTELFVDRRFKVDGNRVICG